MQELTKRPVPLPFRAAGVPQAMKDEARWCVWRYEHRDGGWTKVPVNARTGGRAQSSNSATYSTYREALAAFNDDREGLAGLGFFLGDRWIGVDVDDCIDSLTDERTALAQEVIDHVPGYAETSPSGEGLKVITRGSIPHTRTRKGLELYADGRFFAITGHKIERELDASETLGAIDCDLTQFYELHFGSASARPSVEDTDLNALIHAKAPAEKCAIEYVRDELLPYLKPETMAYLEWLGVGQALHHQGQGDDEWCDLWDEWSQLDPERYAEGVCAEKWDGFGRPGGGAVVTLRTLLHKVKELRALEKYESAAKWSTRIAASKAERELTETIPQGIASDLLVDDTLREKLAQQLQRHLKDECKTRYPIAKVRGWMKPQISHDHGNAPAWVRPYVYVRDQDRFYDIERKTVLTRASFNATHNRDMPKNDFGDPVKQAADGATDLYGIVVVDSALYQPALGQFFTFAGRECVNTYDASQIPTVPPVLTDEEEAAVAVVQQHLRQWLPNDRERELFVSWLAFVVQNPGVKVRWAPYLCGVQGDGKSFFGDMLGAVMGSSNYRSMSGELINGSTFTDWAAGQCVTMIEEVKLHGANRFEAANKIKPFITNETVDVHPKGRASYNTPNTVNYIIASNFIDGMPVTDDDRRFMFLQSAFSTASLKAFRARSPDFYKRLFAAIKDHAGAIRFWLAHFNEWHAEFAPDGNAPHTRMREDVIELSLTDTQSACRTVFESGCPGVTDSWVAVKLFAMAVAHELGPHSGRSSAAIGTACAQYLKDHGYVSMGKERHRVRVGEKSIASGFWCHESLCTSDSGRVHNWWPEAEEIIKKSIVDATAQEFLR